MKVKKKHLTGEIADFPLHVVQRMVDEQVRQGNKADPSVFARSTLGGFIWPASEQGGDFWYKVISKRQFHLIPKPEKTKGHTHAKLMTQYAKDAKVSETPWEDWECRNADVSEDWYELDSNPIWSPLVEYRRKGKDQVESKEKPTPHEIIQAMLDRGMVVWAGVSDYSYDAARNQVDRCVYCVIGYDADSNYPVRTHPIHWKYAVPVDTTTMTEITELP